MFKCALILLILVMGQQIDLSVNPEIARLAIDNAKTWSTFPLNWKLVEDQNQSIRKLIAEGKVQTGPDYLKAEAIVGRHITPDDQLLAHVLALDSLALGDLEARWVAAETMDHFLQSVGSRQIFGTQFVFINPAQPRRRAETDTSLLNDPIRQLLCVAPLAGTAAAPETLKTGINIALISAETVFPSNGQC